MAGGIYGGWRRQRERGQLRHGELRDLVLELGRQDFRRRHGDVTFGPIVVLVAAYLEADNIGPVLKDVPATVAGLDVTTLVVVDGGDDGTEDVAEACGAHVAMLPVNLGQGAALRLGYELAREGGARYVVTIDADGQNDPSELPVLLGPLLAGDADFVIGSRRLGIDHTSNRFRRAGVVVFSHVINRLTGQHLSDTSNGFRALRAEVLGDVVLEQDQYQTAELIISASSHGWRLAEVPTVWRPRASGESKKGHDLLFGANYARVVARTWWREHR